MTNRFDDLRKDNNLQTVDLTFTKLIPVPGSRFPKTEQATIRAAKIKPSQDVSEIRDLIFTLGTGELLEIAEISELAEMEIGQPVKQTDGKPCPDGEYILPDGTIFKVWNSKIKEIIYAND